MDASSRPMGFQSSSSRPSSPVPATASSCTSSNERRGLSHPHSYSSSSSSKRTGLSWSIPSIPHLYALAVTALLLCSSSLISVNAHTIDVAPNSMECFFEDLSAEDKMTVTYQVAAGGDLDVDFWVSNPRGDHMYTLNKMDTGTYSFTAHLDGRYTYCFSNTMSSVTAKTISFNVHGVMYVEDDGHTAPIEKEIRALSEALQAVKDEQEYIVTRERLHRDTAESTNDRVKWWSIIQTVLLMGVCAFQVFYLRRFFEVKR